MTTPIALQLYTVREALAQDFAGVIRQVAEIGYDGVETAGFPGTTPEAAARLFQELGLTVASAHTPLPLGDRKQETLDTMALLGCQRMICAYLSPDEYGFSLCLHNHWWEFEPVEGQYPYQLWLERLDPTIFYEIDTYWVKTAGLDPAAVVQEFGERAPLLHIKDGPAVKDQPMTAVGEGVMDFPDLLRAAGNHPEWLIVELDRCATDMLEAVAKSYRYLSAMNNE
jgi:sugar phosphate isomerase/epimerase